MFGTPASAAATCAFGGSTDGTRCCVSGCASVAALAGLTALLAPATAAAVRNFRRSSLGLFFAPEAFFGISVSHRHHFESAFGIKTAAAAT
jgi:hypothetical protein